MKAPLEILKDNKKALLAEKNKLYTVSSITQILQQFFN